MRDQLSKFPNNLNKNQWGVIVKLKHNKQFLMEFYECKTLNTDLEI